MCYKYTDKIKIFLNLRALSFMWLIFVIYFIACRPLRDILVTNDSQSIIVKFCVYVGNNISQFLYSTTGLIAFYCTVFVAYLFLYLMLRTRFGKSLIG